MEENITEPITDSLVAATAVAPETETAPTESALPASNVQPETGSAIVHSEIDFIGETPAEPAPPAAIEASAVEPTTEVETPEATLAPQASDIPVIETPKLTPDGKPMSIMEQLLSESNAALLRVLHHGDVIDGTVAFRDSGEILVDIGAKSEGIIPSKEMLHMTPDEMSDVQVGRTILVYVVQPENQDGYAVLSLDKAKAEKVWRVLQKQHEANEIIEAPVVGSNKGGLLVDLDGVRGFVPSSQVSSLAGMNEASKQNEMNRLNGVMLPLKVIEINRSRNRLILSERQATLERRDAIKDRLMSELEVGQVREGRVTSIAEFGAFVDIGGADGLVHLSELSWSRVSRPDEVVRVGDRVKVTVLSIDKNSRKVALSLKQTQPEPWSQVMEQYEQNQVVQGTITQIANFGAFARIADGVEGLIHVSELSDNRAAQPRQIVREGDVVNVKIIRIDPQRRRMGLSLKQVVGDGFEMFVSRAPEPEGRAATLEPLVETDIEIVPDATPASDAPAETTDTPQVAAVSETADTTPNSTVNDTPLDDLPTLPEVDNTALADALDDQRQPVEA